MIIALPQDAINKMGWGTEKKNLNTELGGIFINRKHEHKEDHSLNREV